MDARAKPLVWEESLKDRWIGTPDSKLGDLAFWIFRHHDGTLKRATKEGWQFYPTLDAAKAAAQADYEALILAALEPAPVPDLVEAGKVLEGVTPGPWRVDGEPWNQIVWSGAENRVCFMAHSNGLDDVRDVATARFIAWCREGVPALIALATAQAAQIAGLEKERDELRKRLEIDHFYVLRGGELVREEGDPGVDGIECRDATIEMMDDALATLRAEVERLRGAVKGLVEILDQHETKGPLPDVALMFCWLAAQEVRAVMRKIGGQ